MDGENREDIRALEVRVAALEAWRNQVLGARKMSWVLWLLFAGIGAFIIELVVARWLATH
jgi:hypothetical protein